MTSVARSLSHENCLSDARRLDCDVVSTFFRLVASKSGFFRCQSFVCTLTTDSSHYADNQPTQTTKNQPVLCGWVVCAPPDASKKEKKKEKKTGSPCDDPVDGTVGYASKSGSEISIGAQNGLMMHAFSRAEDGG